MWLLASAHVRPQCRQRRHVIRVHPVADRFAVGEFTVGGDRRLQIDQTDVGRGVLKDRQRLAPGPAPIHGERNAPVHPLGQANIAGRIPHIPFAQLRFAGMRQDLIDATAEHDVTAQQHRHHIRIASHSGPPPPSGNRRNTHPMAYIARHTIGRRRPRGWGRRSSRPRPKVTLPATNRAYLAERCPSAVVTRCSRAARSRHARCRRTASPAGRSSSCASQRCETTGRIGFGWRKTR